MHEALDDRPTSASFPARSEVDRRGEQRLQLRLEARAAVVRISSSCRTALSDFAAADEHIQQLDADGEVRGRDANDSLKRGFGILAGSLSSMRVELGERIQHFRSRGCARWSCSSVLRASRVAVGQRVELRASMRPTSALAGSRSRARLNCFSASGSDPPCR